MDKHDRPYNCPVKSCEKLQGFTYPGGLLRPGKIPAQLNGTWEERSSFRLSYFINSSHVALEKNRNPRFSAIYSATEVFMTQDSSTDFADTERFLDARLEDAGNED